MIGYRHGYEKNSDGRKYRLNRFGNRLNKSKLAEILSAVDRFATDNHTGQKKLLKEAANWTTGSA